MLHSSEPARRARGCQLRSVRPGHSNPAQGAQGRIPPVRAELLPPVPSCRTVSRAGGHLYQPRRLSLHRAAGSMSLEGRADPFGAGPYSRTLARLGLMKSDGLRVGRRALLLAVIAWVPLVLLSAVEGLALRPDPRESMLLDIAAHARYLIGLPLLVIAEAVCLPQLASIARHFDGMGLIPPANRPRYDQLLESTRRLLSSPWTDISILLLAYAATLGLAPRLHPESVSTGV